MLFNNLQALIACRLGTNNDVTQEKRWCFHCFAHNWAIPEIDTDPSYRSRRGKALWLCAEQADTNEISW